jgi:hypothetical protein
MSYMKNFLMETAEMMGMDLDEENYDEIYLAARIRLDAELAKTKPGVIGLVGFGKPPVQMPDGTIVTSAQTDAVGYSEEDPVAREIDRILDGEEEDGEWVSVWNESDEEVLTNGYRILHGSEDGQAVLDLRTPNGFVAWSAGDCIPGDVYELEELGVHEIDECDSQVIYDDVQERADDEERRLMKLSQAIDDNDVVKAVGYLKPNKDE